MWILLIIVISFVTPGQAAELQLWGLSYHTDRVETASAKWNEQNTGAGLKVNEWSIGFYQDSMNKQSPYIAYEYEINDYLNIVSFAVWRSVYSNTLPVIAALPKVEVGPLNILYLPQARKYHIEETIAIYLSIPLD